MILKIAVRDFFLIAYVVVLVNTINVIKWGGGVWQVQ